MCVLALTEPYSCFSVHCPREFIANEGELGEGVDPPPPPPPYSFSEILFLVTLSFNGFRLPLHSHSLHCFFQLLLPISLPSIFFSLSCTPRFSVGVLCFLRLHIPTAQLLPSLFLLPSSQCSIATALNSPCDKSLTVSDQEHHLGLHTCS